MNEATLFRVVLARDLLSSGVEQASGVLPTERMAAALFLDQAVELLLRAVLPSVGEHPQRDDNLGALLEKLCKARPKLISHREPLEELRRLRNRVQHDGGVPSHEDTRLFALQAQAAFISVVEGTLEVSPAELTLATLIHDQRIQEPLLVAERAVAESEPEEACTAAAIAFTRLKERVLAAAYGSAIVPPGQDTLREILRRVADAAAHASTGHAGARGDNELARFRENFVRNLRSSSGLLGSDPFAQVIWPVLLAQYGVPLEALRRFQEIAPHLSFGFQAELVRADFRSSPSLEDARFVVDFAVRAALRLESATTRGMANNPTPNANDHDRAPTGESDEGPSPR